MNTQLSLPTSAAAASVQSLPTKSSDFPSKLEAWWNKDSTQRNFGLGQQKYLDALEATQREFSFNASEAAKNREWQERMSNTSYLRAIKDLEAAGLNPILAAMQGGATTPSGSSASGHAKQANSKGLIGEMGPMLLTLALGLTKANIAAKAKVTSASIAADASIKKAELYSGKHNSASLAAKAKPKRMTKAEKLEDDAFWESIRNL